MGYNGAKIKYNPPADVESCVYVKQVLLTIVNGREDLLAEFEAKLQRESTERMRKFLVKVCFVCFDARTRRKCTAA